MSNYSDLRYQDFCKIIMVMGRCQLIDEKNVTKLLMNFMM